MSGLTDCYGSLLAADDPLAPLARGFARVLVEAGFTLHHCSRHHPLYRLGGVCLLLVTGRHDPGGSEGVVVSWTTHDLMSLDWDRGSEYYGVQDVMNAALGQVLAAVGYQVCPFGTGGAWMVTGRRSRGQETGR